MRAGIAIAALLGVAGFSVAACAQSPCAGGCGTTPVYQEAASCGCNSGSCGGGCGLGNGGGLSGINLGYRDKARQVLNPLCCDLGDPWTLSGFLHGDCEPTINIGGWLQSGYHSESNDLFNNRPDDINLHQAWLYAEKSITDDSPFGFRADLVYGIDGADTQAFGNNPGEWDFQNGFDHGRQSWAIPQLYGEVQLGEWNVKGGHFYTLIGYEVVTAPDNFFYSHAITFFNTEPFTHTGVVASRDIGEDITFYGGWTAGWDTGFDQFGGGSNWLGGASFQLTENSSLTYISTAGDFGARGSDAYSHSFVYDTQLSDKLNWVVQSDMLRVNETGEDNVGLNQYLLYTVNDCLGFGLRAEWWKGDVLTGYAPHGGDVANSSNGSLSYYDVTFGMNVRASANTILRPEIRYDWSPAADYEQAIFGIDAITTF